MFQQGETSLFRQRKLAIFIDRSHLTNTMPDTPNHSPGLLAQFAPLATYGRRALILVWATSRLLTLALAALTVIAGLLPAAIAWVGKELVDSVVLAIEQGAMNEAIWFWLSLEALLVAAMAARPDRAQYLQQPAASPAWSPGQCDDSGKGPAA